MELYKKVSYAVSRQIISSYSTSFSSSSMLFPKGMRIHIEAIYGLVRIADEVVDTYRGTDALEVLNELESEVDVALKRNYSTNPVVHAFILSANSYGINKKLIRPFFASMAMDIKPLAYTPLEYKKYIYGSAEVIGLMCLRIFVNNDDSMYGKLKTGAKALGSAYQKVNFLRDISADYLELGRMYFPNISFETFSEDNKNQIITDIENDFVLAKNAAARLPQSSKRAVVLSITYYSALLNVIKNTPVSELKQKRIRINNFKKSMMLLHSYIPRKQNNEI